MQYYFGVGVVKYINLFEIVKPTLTGSVGMLVILVMNAFVSEIWESLFLKCFSMCPGKYFQYNVILRFTGLTG